MQQRNGNGHETEWETRFVQRNMHFFVSAIVTCTVLSHIMFYMFCFQCCLQEVINQQTFVCHVGQETGVPHCNFIDRMKENMILTPIYLGDLL